MIGSGFSMRSESGCRPARRSTARRTRPSRLPFLYGSSPSWLARSGPKSAWGRYWGWDPKETWAFITLVIYASYLHARATAGWRGRPAAIVALVGFGAFMFSYIGVNIFFFGLHSYGGV